jgi:lipopolysaccharide biosynthesis glycosyltransferase
MAVLHVACAVEPNYVPHSAAMLHSVLAQRGEHELVVHYLHPPEFRSEDGRLLARMVDREGGSVSFTCVPDEKCSGLPTRGFTRKATWYRALVAELLPDLDRVLFLDADLIALDSLEPLWETPLDGRYLAAVTNVFHPNHLHRPAELGMTMPQSYFNAGVLLMDLELMRHDGCTEALREYAVANAERLTFRDQDALNVVLGERRLPLHPRWNCMNGLMEFAWAPFVFGTQAVEEARRNPAIRHFEGQGGLNKPWHYLYEGGMREVYLEHRRQTPWPDCRLEGATGRNALRRIVRRARRRLCRGLCV